MFKTLALTGAVTEKIYPGIYRISGIINFPVQIVVTKELEKGEHSVLKVLTGNADEYDVRRFIGESRKYVTPLDKQNVDAVLQVCISSNKELFQQLRKEKAMCVALNNLMQEELDAREARGEISGANKLKEAILAIQKGLKPSEIRKKYGKEIYETAQSVVKSLS